MILSEKALLSNNFTGTKKAFLNILSIWTVNIHAEDSQRLDSDSQANAKSKDNYY